MFFIDAAFNPLGLAAVTAVMVLVILVIIWSVGAVVTFAVWLAVMHREKKEREKKDDTT